MADQIGDTTDNENGEDGRLAAYTEHARLEGLEYGGGPNLRPITPTVSRHYFNRDPQVVVDHRDELGTTDPDPEREQKEKRAYCDRQGYVYVVVSLDGISDRVERDTAVETAIAGQLRIWRRERRGHST